MTKQEAWELLIKATASINANRAGHEKITEALRVLHPEEESEE